MRRLLVSLAGAVAAYAWVACVSAADVPHASSSVGPALTSFQSHLSVAWTADSHGEPRKVWYSTLDGVWTPPAEVPGASTSVAPALAVAGSELYLATTGVDDHIHYYASTSGTFTDDAKRLCDSTSCAHTLAAPALASQGASLFAAWTTPTGSIRYAERENGAWALAPLPIPHAATKPATAPALAVYLGRLFVAWLSPQDETLWVASTPLPLTSDSWSEPAKQISVRSKVAPALGVLPSTDSASGTTGADEVLYLAWANEDSLVKFARWESLFGQWVRTDSPVPLPAGELTSVSPALSICIRAQPATSVADALAAAAPLNGRYPVVAVTTPQTSIDILCGQHVTPPK